MFWSTPASANCVNPGQEAAVAAAQQASSSEPVVVEINTCGGDDTSYQVPLSVDVTFDGQTFNSVYATTNSVITFGRPDGTYWDYPQTPSISLYSFDWVVYPQWRSDEHLIIRSSDGGFQVDISARPIWLQNTAEPTHIVITAAILSDGTVAMAYTLTGPEYPQNNPRTGVRLNNGTVVDFETYGIQETEETPELAPEPTEEAPFTPEPTPTPTPTPEPIVYTLNQPTNLVAQQLQDGSVQLSWDAPSQSNTAVERYAVNWNNQSGGWGVASTGTSITLSPEVFSSSGGLNTTYSFTIRADNDTQSVYSSLSEPVTLSVAAPTPPPTPPTIPNGATVSNEGSFVEVVAPQGQRIANAMGYYGDPNDSTRGQDVSSILFQLLSGSTSATVEVSNDTFQNDPAPGTPKILILLITYEDIPVQPTPEPTPTPTPEPTQPPVVPVEPVVPPTIPVVPEPEPVQPVEPEPEPTEIPTEPEKPEPPIVEPEEPAVEPSPKPPIEEPIDPIVPETPSEVISDLENIDPSILTEEEVTELIEAAEAVLEVSEPGSPEYEQALDALFVAAQADDLELPSELAAIPLLGDVAGAALEIFNNLGNVGSDMSPKVREKAEDIVVVSVVVAQVVGVSAISAMSSTSIRKP